MEARDAAADVITAGIIFAAWAAGAIAAYALDRDPRADRRERMQWATMWPLVVLIGLILGAAALTGIIWRSVAYRV